jgi:hypothetical protein
MRLLSGYGRQSNRNRVNLSGGILCEILGFEDFFPAAATLLPLWARHLGERIAGVRDRAAQS